MGGIVQSIDVDVRLNGGQIELPETIAVTDCEVTRIYGGGGSEAKIDVIFEDALSDEQISGLRRSVRSASQNPRFDDVENFVDEEEIEDPRETLTFSDLEAAIANGDIETEPADTGEDVKALGAIENGRIVSDTVSTVDGLAGANLLKNVVDSDAGEIANYADAPFTEKAAFENEESLSAQARVRGLVTKEQVRTVQEKAKTLISNRQNAVEEARAQNETERAQRINELDQTGGAPNQEDVSQDDGLIDPDKLFAGEPITVEIDAVVNQIRANDIKQDQHRLFTGTVTKATETNDRKVRFECVDARYQLNNFIVRADVKAGTPRYKIVDEILGGGAVYGSDEDINSNALGSESGVTGVAASAENVSGTEAPTDPAKNISLADLSNGLSADTIRAENASGTLTPTEIAFGLEYDTDVVSKISAVTRSTTTDASDITLAEFPTFSNGRITNIANDSEVGFAEKRQGKVEVTVGEIKTIQDFISDLIKPKTEVGPYGIRPDGYQEEVEKAKSRKESAQQAEEEAVATYEIQKNGEDTIPKAQSWGVNFHKTAYNVIQELGYRSSAQLYIDEYNTIYWAQSPERDTWSPNGDGDKLELPPIVSWESGDEKTEKDVIVESKYDETALGAFHPLTTKSVPDDVEEPSGGLRDTRVTTANELENTKVSEVVDREVKMDSGTIRVTGNPNITAQDKVILDEDAVDGFAAISQGEYFAKEVKHIINSDEGYVTDIELGNNIDELYEEFAYEQSGLAFEDETNPDDSGEGSEEQTGDVGIPETDNPFFGFLDDTIGDGDGEIEGLGGGDEDLNPFD
jgi:hypothetical protein